MQMQIKKYFRLKQKQTYKQTTNMNVFLVRLKITKKQNEWTRNSILFS